MLAQDVGALGDGVLELLRAGGLSGIGEERQVLRPVDRLVLPFEGVDTLLHAMAELPEARLRIVGDGPMRPSWEALAADLHLADRVTFAGDVPDATLASAYHTADVFVLPANARAEAFGTVLLEAMAAGLPVVSTELGTGTSWVNQAGVTGCVVPPRDPHALAHTLRMLLADAALRRRMGRAGRARVHAEFTLARMAERVEAVYRRVLTACSATTP